jgi:acetolactate synthase-1/2/3 large subunit
MQIRKAAAAAGGGQKAGHMCRGGVIAANAAAEMLELAERRNIPVVTTLMGIGAIPSAHPLHFEWWGPMADRQPTVC